MAEHGPRKRRGKVGVQPYCKACMVAATRASREKHPDRNSARGRMNWAIRSGALVVGPCYAASPECDGPVEGHHRDYTKPFEVTWACRKHHRALDRERRAGAA